MTRCGCGGERIAPGRPCRVCAAAHSRVYRKRHREKVAAANRASVAVWRRSERGRASDRARRATAEYRAAERVWKQRRKDRDPGTWRAKAAARSRRWRAEHPERVRQIREAARPAETARQRARYYADHERSKLHQRLRAMRRRARMRAAAGRATVDQIAARVAYYGYRCWMCGQPWEALDHVIPVVRGGSNWPSNIRPACTRCNRRKWAHKPAIAKALSA